MEITNSDFWKEKGIGKEHHKYFYSCWSELFSPHSIPTWRVRSSSIFSIILELSRALETIKGKPNTHKSINILLEEIFLILSRNKEFYGEILPLADIETYLNHIKGLYEYYKDKESLPQQTIEKMQGVTVIILSLQKNYYGSLLRSIREIIEKDQIPEREYNKFYFFISLFATEAIHRGVSYRYLNSRLELLENPDETFENRAKKLLHILLGEREQLFSCEFIARFPANSYEGLQKIDNIKIVLEEQNVGDYLQDKIIINVKAIDFISAYLLAEEKLNEAIALIIVNKIYPYKTTIPYRIFSLQNEKSQDFTAELSKVIDLNPRSYIASPKQIQKSFDIISHASSSPQLAPLTASISFYKISKESSSPELELINLWIALEVLIPQQNHNQAIIAAILDTVPKFSVLQYRDEILRDYAKSLKRFCSIYTDSEETFIPMNNKKYSLDDIEKTVICSYDKERDKELSKHIYLKVRTMFLSEYFFKDASIFQSKIKNHQKNIEFQINRIYRTRNYIVHQAKSSTNIRITLEHLDSYYLSAVHQIISEINRLKTYDVSIAVTSLLMKYEKLMKTINKESETAKAIKKKS